MPPHYIDDENTDPAGIVSGLMLIMICAGFAFAGTQRLLEQQGLTQIAFYAGVAVALIVAATLMAWWWHLDKKRRQ